MTLIIREGGLRSVMTEEQCAGNFLFCFLSDMRMPWMYKREEVFYLHI